MMWDGFEPLASPTARTALGISNLLRQLRYEMVSHTIVVSVFQHAVGTPFPRRQWQIQLLTLRQKYASQLPDHFGKRRFCLVSIPPAQGGFACALKLTVAALGVSGHRRVANRTIYRGVEKCVLNCKIFRIAMLCPAYSFSGLTHLPDSAA